MREGKVEISPGEIEMPGRERRKSRNKPRGKSRSWGVRGRKVRISPGEVKKPGREGKKSKNKPRGSQEAGA